MRLPDRQRSARKASKVKLLPRPDSQQKLSCCQARISGGALLTLHLLPSVPALSPFLCGEDEGAALGSGRSRQTARRPACRSLPPSALTEAADKGPMKLFKKYQDVAFSCTTEDMRTSQLPPGVRLQYIHKPKAEFFSFLIVVIVFNHLFCTQKWQKTQSVVISAPCIPGFNSLMSSTGLPIGALRRPSSSACLSQPVTRCSSLPDGAFTFHRGTSARVALNPEHVAHELSQSRDAHRACRAYIFKDLCMKP